MRNTLTVRALTGLALLAVLAGAAQANLLVNGGFEGGGSSPCAAGWLRSSANFPPAVCKYDGTVHYPVPPTYEGLHRGSTDLQTSGAGDAHIYQVVSVDSGKPVRLTGKIAGGATVAGYTFFARIHDGGNLAAPALAAFETPSVGWQDVDISGTPTGTQVTVEWGFSGSTALNWSYLACHADAMVLTQASGICTGELTVSALSQDFGSAGSTTTGLQLTGTNFDSTCQVILQASGLPDIQAVNETAGAGGTTLTFDVPLLSAAMGARNLVVTKASCADVTVNNAFYVVMPSLTNGSFENPTEPSSCPNPPTPRGAPDGWLQMGVSTEMSHLLRDSNQYMPGCPRPDGEHYASVLVPVGSSFGDWAVFQYVATTPGQPITVSGMFAGGGRTTVELKIMDGSQTGQTLATTIVERRRGCPLHAYDWVRASVSATPTKGFVTVLWDTQAQQNQHASIDIVHTSHVDNLTLTAGGPPAELCGNALDDDGDRQTDCQDADCAAEPACASPPVEVCGNGADEDGDLAIDCDDTDCSASCVEICNNGQDDDGDCIADDGCTEECDNDYDDNQDGLTDCEDPECAASPLCIEICDNAIDDDNDGLLDCYDSACRSFATCACSDPAPDSDGDTDVDMTDFAAFQRCFNAQAIFAQSCQCFDGDRDGDVDDGDALILIYCATGANVGADPNCD